MEWIRVGRHYCHNEVAYDMKKILPIFIFSFFINNSLFGEPLQAKSDYIFDGDTFSAQAHLANGAKISVRVRIRNIDAPEIHGECDYEIQLAQMARQRLSALLPKGTIVTLDNIKDDKYLGRIDALVNLDGQDIGKIMIDGKLARKYNGGKRMPWCDNNKENKEKIKKE